MIALPKGQQYGSTREYSGEIGLCERVERSWSGEMFKEEFPRKINLNLGQKDATGKSRKDSMCKDPGVVGCIVHFSKGAEKMPT